MTMLMMLTIHTKNTQLQRVKDDGDGNDDADDDNADVDDTYNEHTAATS